MSKAILDANALPGDHTITLQTSLIVTGVMKTLVNTNTKVIANNFSVNGGNTFRPFFVKSGTVNFSNMTAYGGNGNYGGGVGGFSGGAAGMGGAIFIRTGSLTLNNATFSSNTATGGTGNINGQGLGGAIFAMQSTTGAVGTLICRLLQR